MPAAVPVFEIPPSPELRRFSVVHLIRGGKYEDFETLVDFLIEEKEIGVLNQLDATFGNEQLGRMNMAGSAACYPIHWACRREDDSRFLKLLVGDKCKVSISVPTEDEMKSHPIHWAASAGLIAHVSILLNASKSGGNAKEIIHDRDSSGCTPLLIAAQNGHANLAAFLIQNGADAMAVDEHNDSALHWAAYNGDPNIVGLMLHTSIQSIHLDAADSYGQTPLHLSAFRGNAEVVQYLLFDAGSQAYNVEDRKGHTPLDLATRKKRDGCIVLLKSYEKRKLKNLSFSGQVSSFGRE